ncbi:MAG: Holliday junction resolvase RuvX [Gammaproteobacteria bacterium]|jgi:putative Holliday junction resolvase|nr:Holliday junction resolvase RuvX [Gammaproteobacteria bacterium]
MGAVLGFDYGTRKIGVAVGQTVTGTATPLVTLPTRDESPDWTAIGRLVADWQPEAFVVGLPLEMDDTEAPVAVRARRFARQLAGRYRLPVHMADERLTTREARRQLGRDGVRDAAAVDAVAARLILETWLNDRD